MWAWPQIIVALLVGMVPVAVVLLTQRAARTNRAAEQRTEVEKLYIAGNETLIKTLQSEGAAKSAKIGALEAEREALRNELKAANHVAESFRQRYQPLLALLERAGVAIPPEFRV